VTKAFLSWLACRLGVHHWCPRGLTPPAARVRCPYKEGFRAGYAWCCRPGHPGYQKDRA